MRAFFWALMASPSHLEPRLVEHVLQDTSAEMRITFYYTEYFNLKVTVFSHEIAGGFYQTNDRVKDVSRISVVSL